MKVIVVGSGIIGASVAWHLARKGAQVVVVTGTKAGASEASFGWINASFYADQAHHALRVASIAAYRRLVASVPEAPVTFCGALWWEAQGEQLRKMHRALQAFDYPVHHITNAQALEPDLRHPPKEMLQFPTEGVADAAALARYLLKRAQAMGAQVIAGVDVTAVLHNETALCGVQTTIGALTSDHVVIAAGNGAPAVLATAGVDLPMLKRPGVLVTTKPARARMRHVLVTPHGELRQLLDGRLLASAVAQHQSDASEEVSETPDQIAQRVLAWLGPMIKGGVAGWDRVTLADRPVPKDGLPVIGAAGPAGLSVAVMHSGVTLAAIVGGGLSAEILGDGGYDAMFKPYRPDRFQAGFEGPAA